MCKSPYFFGLPEYSSCFLLPGCHARHLGRAQRACAKLSPKTLPCCSHAEGKWWSFSREYTEYTWKK